MKIKYAKSSLVLAAFVAIISSAASSKASAAELTTTAQFEFTLSPFASEKDCLGFANSQALYFNTFADSSAGVSLSIAGCKEVRNTWWADGGATFQITVNAKRENCSALVKNKYERVNSRAISQISGNWFMGDMYEAMLKSLDISINLTAPLEVDQSWSDVNTVLLVPVCSH